MANTAELQAIADMFNGRVSQREYSSPLAVEYIVLSRTYLVSLTVEQVFTFEGLTEAQANNTTAVEVVDVGGTTYTVPFMQSFTDGSTGYAICPQEQVEIQRERMSPHLWRVTVTRRGSRLSRYGQTVSLLFDAPSWATPYLPALSA